MLEAIYFGSAMKPSTNRTHVIYKGQNMRVTEYRAFVILLHEDRILMLQYAQGKCKNRWGLPGGCIQRGEYSFTAAFRELLEETGIKKDTISLEKHVIRYMYEKHSKQIIKTTVLLCTIKEQPDVILSHEHMDYKWVYSFKDIIDYSKEEYNSIIMTAKRSIMDLLPHFS